MTGYRWFVRRTNPEYISYLSKALSVSPAFSQVLINRGIKNPDEAGCFLRPSFKNLPEPFSLEGMGAAVDAVRAASRDGKKILVHGDYDADGLTATAIMVGTLRRLGMDVDYHIPNRFKDGYGFNTPGIVKAKAVGAAMIITVDCGVTSFEAARLAKKEGIALVITDHHEPVRDPLSGRPILPEAASVLNPKVTSPETECPSGAGIALKLSQALIGDAFKEFVDLAAIGTMADSVPLIGENRIIVKEGIDLIKTGERAAIRALKEAAGLNGRETRAWSLSYLFAPRINAAGRLSDASCVVEFLLSEKLDEAIGTATELNRLNTERQKIEERILSSALSLIEQEDLIGPAVVLWAEDWHEGVIGIVASRLAERFGRPAFVFSVKDGFAKGSARSVPGLDVLDAISEAGDVLTGFGGHAQAAGLRMKAERLGEFKKRINEAVEKRREELLPELHIDADSDLRELGFGLLDELGMLEPFGAGNPEPVFGAKGLDVISPRVVGGRHLKMRLKSRGRSMDAIWFDKGGLIDELKGSPAVDAAFTPELNEWEGGRSVQLNLKALRKTPVN